MAERGRLLQATLDQFGVETTLLDPVVGPTVTRYVLELGEGVKVSKLESLRKDIAYAMASPDVRILAPIPGRRAIGVEVPNSKREIITVGDILGSKEARQATHPLEVAVGRDINGRNMMINLATMPHVLIAGATGAGKSSCLNSLLTSILMRSTPDQVRLILVDPKRVEMGQYDKAPHLLTAPVTDPRKAANALAWAVREMERRYDLLHKVGFRDITGYNQAVDNDTLTVGLGEVDEAGEPLTYRRLPFILVVVDELADLMMVAARDVEESIARIAQMARAVGIHLVIATQRPSVNVITGVIKANVPARLAFAVSSLTDSRVILDQPGAERLVGKGDLLMLGPSSSSPHRVQGCWVEEDEVRAIVKHWKDQAPEFTDDHSVATESDADSADGAPAPMPSMLPGGVSDTPPSMDLITDAPPDADEDGDDLLVQAMELVVQTQLGSTSMLQRKLRVGFARAGRIMDLLEEKGVVGPSTGSKAREVLITADELAARRAAD
ncbi:MAG: DNA translocase FtsK [Acidimicrobiales bacterium]